MIQDYFYCYILQNVRYIQISSNLSCQEYFNNLVKAYCMLQLQVLVSGEPGLNGVHAMVRVEEARKHELGLAQQVLV